MYHQVHVCMYVCMDVYACVWECVVTAHDVLFGRETSFLGETGLSDGVRDSPTYGR